MRWSLDPGLVLDLGCPVPAEVGLEGLGWCVCAGVDPALACVMATAIEDKRIWALACEALERRAAGRAAVDEWGEWLEWAELVAVLAAWWTVAPDGWCEDELVSRR